MHAFLIAYLITGILFTFNDLRGPNVARTLRRLSWPAYALIVVATVILWFPAELLDSLRRYNAKPPKLKSDKPEKEDILK